MEAVTAPFPIAVENNYASERDENRFDSRLMSAMGIFRRLTRTFRRNRLGSKL